jgi:hypothetical protein
MRIRFIFSVYRSIFSNSSPVSILIMSISGFGIAFISRKPFLQVEFLSNFKSSSLGRSPGGLILKQGSRARYSLKRSKYSLSAAEDD